MHEHPLLTYTSVDFGICTRKACYYLVIRGRIWNPEQDELVKGMSFDDKEILKIFLQVYLIRTHQWYEITQTNSKH